MKALSRLIAPPGWLAVERDGFVMHVDPQRQSPLAFALSVAAGLDSRPRRLDASYLYDAPGSALFERITVQPEYYLTRVEDSLLEAHAHEIREVAGAGMLVELGSGTSTKTRRLLDAWTRAGAAAYVPVDVDPHALEQACAALRARYPTLMIQGLAASYERGLALLRRSAPMTVAFLGSSLGNLGWQGYPEFCETVSDALAADDHFLVGLDLVKEPARLEAAYNDAAGVTAAFTRNLFARINRELEADIPRDAIAHVAFYDGDRERIEIFAEARRELEIPVRALGRTFRIARGERILTEVSHKFRPEAAIATIERHGFRLAWQSTGDGQFGLFLFRRRAAGKPDPRDALAADIRDRVACLHEMRARTQAIVAPLSDEDLLRQHSALMSPIAWDLGHIAQFEETWLLAGGDGAVDPAQVAAYGQPLARLYDPLATPRARRALLPLPAVSAVRQRLQEVRWRVEETLARPPRAAPPPAGAGAGDHEAHPSLDPASALQLVVQHEAQHQETIWQAVALREDLIYQPAFVQAAVAARGGRPLTESVLVPAGGFEMGTHDRTRAYDNERPAHRVELSAFRIDRAPVTNGRYVAFMHDGGYSRRELWSEAGWDWLQRTAVRAPGHWRPTTAAEGGWTGGWRALAFGRLQPLHPDDVVVHVSWYEAAAYARWSGGRLPTEAEWEKAAAWDPTCGRARRCPWGDAPWEPGRANLDQLRLEPSHAGAYPDGRSAYGCEQMLGDVWEWTDTWFGGYPGFESFPYREYSEIFFGQTYRVLRGGSFATRAVVARNTFRNWDLPERRQIFAGFRCARPA